MFMLCMCSCGLHVHACEQEARGGYLVSCSITSCLIALTQSLPLNLELAVFQLGYLVSKPCWFSHLCLQPPSTVVTAAPGYTSLVKSGCWWGGSQLRFSHLLSTCSYPLKLLPSPLLLIENIQASKCCLISEALPKKESWMHKWGESALQGTITLSAWGCGWANC